MTVLSTIQRMGCVAALLTAVSCGSSPWPDSTPFTEHRTSKATLAVKHLGEDCTSTGSSICLSHVCGHFASLPDRGYFCTRPCEAVENCPRDWHCNQVYPTPKGRLCVPPPGWDGKVAILRAGGVE